MQDKITKIQNIVLDKTSGICKKFGLNNVMAQLYVVLYFSEKPLSLDEMVERLKISKGSVSVNIRALERYGAARRVWIKGTRKDYYEAEGDIAEVILKRVRSMAQGRLSEVEEMIRVSRQVLDSAGSGDKEDGDSLSAFRGRFEKMESLFNEAKSIIELFSASGLMRQAKGDEKKVPNTV